MSKSPLVSVIMSVYKEPVEWLRQSIDSILYQTFKDFEFIIISDNPSYIEGNSLLKKYAEKDSRIILVFNEENIGLTKSLNKGLGIAKGKYIARMDADDVSLKDRLEVQVEYLMAHKEISVCGMGIIFMGQSKFCKKHYPVEHDDVCNYMLFENPFAHPVVMYRKIVNGWAVRYDESINKAQDYKLWLDIYNKGGIFHNLYKIGLKYRVSSQQISRNGILFQKSVADTIRGNLLKEQYNDKVDVLIHNAVCRIEKDDINLCKKLEWLQFIRRTLYDRGQLTKVIENKLFELWVANCIEYRSYIKLFSYPSYNACARNAKTIVTQVFRSII